MGAASIRLFTCLTAFLSFVLKWLKAYVAVSGNPCSSVCDSIGGRSDSESIGSNLNPFATLDIIFTEITRPPRIIFLTGKPSAAPVPTLKKQGFPGALPSGCPTTLAASVLVRLREISENITDMSYHGATRGGMSSPISLCLPMSSGFGQRHRQRHVATFEDMSLPVFPCLRMSQRISRHVAT